MLKIVHNERVKLMATFANNVAVAAFITGLVLPQFSNDPAIRSAWLFPFLAGASLAVLMNGAAFWLLGKLRE